MQCISIWRMIAKCYRDGREGSSSRCGHRSCRPDRLQPPLPGGNLSILYTRVIFCSGCLWICLWRRPGKSQIYCKLLLSCTHLSPSTPHSPLSSTCSTSPWPWAPLEESSWSCRTAHCLWSGLASYSSYYTMTVKPIRDVVATDDPNVAFKVSSSDVAMSWKL